MKILLVVGNQILCEGVRLVLGQVLPVAIIADRFCSFDAFEPDIVLFASGEDAEPLRANYPQAYLVCLDLGLNVSEIASLLFCHGVRGIIQPTSDVQLFAKALHSIHSGELWISQNYLKTAMCQNSLHSARKNIKVLSDQDRQIISLISDGCRNSEIAEVLCLSESTVKAHVSRLFKTLKVKNRAQLTRLGVMHQLPSSPHQEPR